MRYTASQTTNTRAIIGGREGDDLSLQPVHCPKCGRLLAMIAGAGTVKCRHCKELTLYHPPKGRFVSGSA